MAAYGLPLGRLYGPAWLNRTLWSPTHKNVWTAEKDASNHHCPDQECIGDIKTRCYDRLHVSFCICVITMANGQQRFCGHRFQTESPKACALHGWGEDDENRLFQRAKKGLAFELPEVFPHEKPGWKMVLSNAGGFLQPIQIRMSLVKDRLCFVRVLSIQDDGRPHQVTEIARVKTKELLLTKKDVREHFRAREGAKEESLDKTAAENHDKENGDPLGFKEYNALALDLADAKKLEEKKAKEARAAVVAAERAAASRKTKKGAKGSVMSYKELIKCK